MVALPPSPDADWPLREIETDFGLVKAPDIDTDLVIQRAMAALDREDQLKLAAFVTAVRRLAAEHSNMEALTALTNAFRNCCGLPRSSRAVSACHWSGD